MIEICLQHLQHIYRLQQLFQGQIDDPFGTVRRRLFLHWPMN